MKHRIKLTESTLRKIVGDSVKRILNEADFSDKALERVFKTREKNRELDLQGRPYVEKFVKLNPRKYRYNDFYKSQADKVFNRGMGSLAFVRFLVDEKVVLVNKSLAKKSDIERIETNFPEWKIEFVELGYPEWYNTKNLKSCRNK